MLEPPAFVADDPQPVAGPAALIVQTLPMAMPPLALRVMLENLRDRREFTFNGDPAVVRRFEALPPAEREQFTLLRGAVPFGIDGPDARARYITMLRDPVESALALYYMVLTTPGHYLHAMVAGQNWSFRDLLEARRPELDNPFVRWLNPPPARPIPVGHVTRDMLEAAKRNLAERYDFGIAERFDESLLLLQRTLGWPDVRYGRFGVVSQPGLRANLPPDTLAAAREVLALDLELYEFAAGLFEERLQGVLPDLHEALAAFRHANSLPPDSITILGEPLDPSPLPPDDQAREVVWIASYPRSGNTWLRFLLDACLFDTPPRQLADVGRSSLELDWWLDAVRRHGYSEDAILRAGRRLRDHHGRPPGVPRDVHIKSHFVWGPDHPLVSRTLRTVYLVRDPRDVLLSGMNFAELTLDTTIEDPRAYAYRFIEAGGDPTWVANGYGAWEQHAASWLSDPAMPTLVVRYEDLKADTAAELTRILGFLGFPADLARIRRAVAQCTLDRLRSLEMATRSGGGMHTLRRADRFFFHQGRSGQSLLALGEDVERAFVERFGPAMARFGYR